MKRLKKILVIIIGLIAIWLIYYHSISLYYQYKENQVQSIFDMPAEYFDTPSKRKMWWYSLKKPWKNVFKTNLHIIDFTDPNKFSLSFLIHYALGFPYIPNDNYLKRIFELKSVTAITNFPFSNFSGTARIRIGFSDISGILNLTNLKYLNIANIRTISNLDGIRRLKNLEYLNCTGLHLDLSEIKYLKKLRRLDCQFNRLFELDFVKDLENIEHLNCWYNKIESLNSIQNLKKLKYFKCADNNLKSLEGLEKLSNLDTLIIYNNPIENWSALDSLDIKIVIKTLSEDIQFRRNQTKEIRLKQEQKRKERLNKKNQIKQNE